MNYNATSIIEKYITYCKMQKMLDEKTLKAYRADLVLFSRFFDFQNICTLTVSDIESYVGYLNQHF